MNDLFKQLQEAKAEQDHVLEHRTPPPEKENTSPGRDAQKVAQKPAQVSKTVSKPLLKGLSNTLTQNAIEELAFSLRKTPQAKINATIPLGWKDKMDDLAFRLKVGKYDLLTYIVGVFLGEVEQPEI